MDKHNMENDLPSIAWMMFNQSGQPGMYMLYHAITHPEDEDKNLLE